VYDRTMSRTNIDLPDDLVARAMAMYHLKTKREAVALALRRLVAEPLSREEALAMEGTGFDLDMETLRPGEEVGDW
jgi:Arc/MetJ family transcription regulator